MTYDFDRTCDRKGTRSSKYDTWQAAGKPEGILPMWLADMDFPSPQCVIDALRERIGHGIFGYTFLGGEYRGVIADWMHRRFEWEISPEWIVQTPGVVCALSAAVCALTSPGDGVLVQPPVYFPFFSVTQENGRRIVENQLQNRDGRYTVDFEDFEKKISENVKLFILCSPHNPVGRVWEEGELRRMGEICQKHGVTVLSDEIHADLVFPGNRHRAFASLGKSFADITVTATSPSKTFNIAGLQCANIIISNPALRSAFKKELERRGGSGVNLLGHEAMASAYRGGEKWLEDLIVYLKGNLDYLRGYLRDNIPDVKLTEPQGTYLAWLDFSAMGMTDAELDGFLTNKAGVWLNSGHSFGAGGSGFARMNIACPRSVLAEGLERLRR